MIYKKDYEIKGKIVKKDDLIKLIIELINKFKNQKIDLKIEANFKDNSSIKSTDINIFDDDYFDKKVLASILIDMFVDGMCHRIYIDLSLTYGIVMISSDDKNKYDSLCHCIEEKIKFLQKQKILYIFSVYPILYIIFYMMVYISSLFIALIIQSNLNITLKFPYILILIISFVFLLYIYKVSKYYSNIQFDFGEKSINKPRNPKFYLLKLTIPIVVQYISAILLPYIASLLIK